MLRTTTGSPASEDFEDRIAVSAETPVNSIERVDSFITAEPSIKPESRRGWRRRRVRRGKS